MLSLRQLENSRVRGEAKKKTGKRPKIGRVAYVLFHPTEPRVVGLAVERSDLALMIKRADRYVALDRITLVDGEVHAEGNAAWDGAAGKRLGIDWDTTVAWTGMPVRTESGTPLGKVRDALFSEDDGKLNALGLSTGTAADVAIGVRDLAASLVRGFDGESVVVGDEAAAVDMDGGAAASAGRAVAVVKVKTEEAVGAAAETAGKAAAVAGERVEEAAVMAGAAAGKAAAYGKAAAKAAAKSDAGKKAMGWLKAMKDEVVDAMGDSGDEPSSGTRGPSDTKRGS